MSSSRVGLLAYLICILGSSFYMYEFMLQVSLGVMTNELMHDLSLNAASLGVVSAFYFYAYMPMQVPAGLLHDRFGPRSVLTFAILVCALGALCFSFSHNMWQASAGRFMMGIGSAFSFSGALMLIARWFPPKHFAVVSGIVQLMSSVGAISGEVPLAVAIEHWGWRNTMVHLFVLGVLLAVLVWLVVRNFPKSQGATPLQNLHAASTKPSFKDVFGKAQSWWVAFYSFLIWAPIAAFAGLWGIPFLVSAYSLSTEAASLACAMIWIGIGVGSPLIGWVSERIERRNTMLAACSFLGIVGAMATIYLSLSPFLLYLSLFLFGIAGSGQSLAFSVVRDVSHPRTMGAAIGLNNMATVAGGAILQPIIGYMVHSHWGGAMVNHVPLYGVTDYRFALFMIPLCYILALIISFFLIKETHCKPFFPLGTLQGQGHH
jgi:MFS family permease